MWLWRGVRREGERGEDERGKKKRASDTRKTESKKTRAFLLPKRPPDNNPNPTEKKERTKPRVSPKFCTTSTLHGFLQKEAFSFVFVLGKEASGIRIG
jgi:hypothetical protein